jgi:hypothetical protein
MALFGQGQNHHNNPLLAQMEAVRAQRSSGERIGLVRGRHHVDWVPTVEQWLREGREDEALALLLEIVEAAEQIARVDQVAPPSGYTTRAVSIFRGRGDDDGELEILERYAAACPPGKGKPELLERLEELLDGD